MRNGLTLPLPQMSMFSKHQETKTPPKIIKASECCHVTTGLFLLKGRAGAPRLGTAAADPTGEMAAFAVMARNLPSPEMKATAPAREPRRYNPQNGVE